MGGGVRYKCRSMDEQIEEKWEYGYLSLNEMVVWMWICERSGNGGGEEKRLVSYIIGFWYFYIATGVTDR